MHLWPFQLPPQSSSSPPPLLLLLLLLLFLASQQSCLCSITSDSDLVKAVLPNTCLAVVIRKIRCMESSWSNSLSIHHTSDTVTACDSQSDKCQTWSIWPSSKACLVLLCIDVAVSLWQLSTWLFYRFLNLFHYVPLWSCRKAAV